MSNPSDYAAGWICALTCEYVAAQEFLDEEHDPPGSLQSNDSNDYTLGRIGRHNVVIAVLPDGEYGTARAASVATSMLNRFPNVRIGLMVGIGGGAPSPTNDVRLGDVVVSAPREMNGVTYGGVFEYDFGKTIQDQAFQETRFLNQPPTTLRAAVRGLQAQYARKGHRLGQAVSDVINKNPMLQGEYSRPNSSTDVLFRSDFTHGSTGCAEFCAKDSSNLVTRRSRTDYQEKSYIHYGTIASANQLMKNAITRDKLAKERNVLCFEMEAAGLMNDFPCLVIRGICDYSDSHKNKGWQGYAAMVAAAYAKDLLTRIVPSRIENEQRIAELLSNALHVLETTGDNVDTIKSRSDRRIELEMLNWLTPIDYGPQQSDIFRRHQPGTGQWVLDSDQFQAWIATSGQALFCPGIPGAGKTIVASVVINHLMEKLREDPGNGLAYIYCDFRRRNEQTVEHFTSSLLKQLAEKQPRLPDAVRQLHKRHEKSRTEPSLEELVESLRSVAETFDHVFIIVDALDECQESNDCLPMLLSELFDLQKQLGVNIFATARPLGHIKLSFERAISIEIRAHREDVRKYVSGRLGELPMVVQNDPELQEDIMNKISEVVDGMFLLAKLHFESLTGKMTRKAIRRTLQSLPTGSSAYDSAYEEAMNRIEDQNRDKRDMAKKTLLWITCAKERLTKSELQEALAVEIGERELDQDNLPDMEDVASVCAGLVAIDEESDVVRLVHYTTQDYFERTRVKWFEGAESHISEVCLTYLLLEQFPEKSKTSQWSYQSSSHRFKTRQIGHWESLSSGPESHFEESMLQLIDSLPLPLCPPASKGEDHFGEMSFEAPLGVIDFQESDGRRPFHRYAARNWGIHVRDASMQEHRQVIASLESHKFLQSSMGDVMGIRTTTGLHLAIRFGLDQTVEALLQRDHDPNVQSRSFHDDTEFLSERWHYDIEQTPLICAVLRDQGKVVRALLSHQANPNWADCLERTALWYAASEGYDDIVKLLMDKGANPDHRDIGERTVLGVACERGHASVVEALLPGAQIDLESQFCDVLFPPLTIAALSDQAAALSGQAGIIETLVKNGATADLGEGWSAGALLLDAKREIAGKGILTARKGVDRETAWKEILTAAEEADRKGPLKNMI
ncbi:hypothetical protein LCI18_014955 [Fusarium solani-melongenae]|uniref:Uncharacterized protein n=1 Tax=Fusarium solani subsp. cucurbitae TaxID=2747967 RepID=A0ACD3ZSG0_FUSSC|nr:hypothetical protein LCI18_014955 [Fusarium solani-melongenae]